MKIETLRSNDLSESHIQAIVHLARQGFGDSPNIQQDTSEHINASNVVQVASISEAPVAFAMYRSCLWR